MSFILDALRKSEHERQRQAGPGLAEVAVAAPRARTHAWATAAIVLFVVNLAVVGVLLMRRGPDTTTAVSTTPVTSPTSAGLVATGPQPSEALREPQLAAPRPPSDVPPMLRPAQSAPAAPTARNPLQEEVSDPIQPLGERGLSDAARVPPGPPAVTRAPSGGGTVIYESLPEADPVRSPAVEAPIQPRPGLPTVDEMQTSGVPELRLELHVYSSVPAERFTFINSRKYREGDTLQEGPQVVEITRDGVVLQYRGSQFLLPRE